MSRHPISSALALLVALTVLLTWPQALHLGTKVAAHDDPLFSIWRLSWIAHALPTDPQHLFDANIFHPHLRALAYSDAMLFQGLVAAPWLWANVNPIVVYNVLLLAGMVSSGVGMFVLARHLTNNLDAALVSAVVFTLVPYRIEHFMHLELQWTVWMPLALWAVHRTIEDGSVRFGLLTGVLLWLQLVSSLYYGAFLAIVVAVLALLLMASEPRLARGAIVPLGVGAMVAAALTLPYAAPYVENTRLLGPRSFEQVSSFSAQLESYLVSPRQNWFWGWTAPKFEGDELHLFPGAASIALALFASARRPRRDVWIYLAITLLAVSLSLGSNGALYRWLHEYIWVFRGFRAPARFSILAFCGLSVLAGFGFEALQRLASARPIGRALLATTIVAIGVECGSAPMLLADVPSNVPPIYRFLQMADQSVVVELPMVGYDLTPLFMYGSIYHWQRLVNGYSGYTPPDYLETQERMRTFPDDDSIARLNELRVRYVLVHQAYYTPEDYAALMSRILERRDLAPSGRYRDWLANTEIFEVKPLKYSAH